MKRQRKCCHFLDGQHDLMATARLPLRCACGRSMPARVATVQISQARRSDVIQPVPRRQPAAGRALVIERQDGFQVAADSWSGSEMIAPSYS
jgi:hypothetical protein